MFVSDGKKFLPTSGYNEDVLEQALMAEEDIFRDFLLVDCKLKAKSTESTKKTLNDLILVSHDCEQWFIVEVEVKNDDYYARNHINNQLATQTRANWRERIVKKLGTKLVEEYGFSANIVMRLEENDPGFLLIIPETTELISEICRKFGVSIIEAGIWKSEDETAIFISDSSMIPEKFDKKRFEAGWQRILGKEIYFFFPAVIVDSIREAGNCFVYIDGMVYSRNLGLKKEISVPLSQEPGSDTHDLSFYENIKPLFTSDFDGDNIHIHFEREEIWE